MKKVLAQFLGALLALVDSWVDKPATGVKPPPAPKPTPAPLPPPTPKPEAFGLGKAIPDLTAYVGESFSYQIKPDAFTGKHSLPDLDDLPNNAGLGFDKATQTISGKPTRTAAKQMKLTASDEKGSLTAEFMLTVLQPTQKPGRDNVASAQNTSWEVDNENTVS